MAADYKTLFGLVKEIVDSYCSSPLLPAGWVERARAAVQPSVTKPVNAPEILHFLPHDPCCSKHFSKVARTGAVDEVETWECPACGTTWQASRPNGTSRHWQPEVAISTFKL